MAGIEMKSGHREQAIEWLVKGLQRARSNGDAEGIAALETILQKIGAPVPRN